MRGKCGLETARLSRILGQREGGLAGAVGLDVVAERDVEVEGLLYATVQHAQPVGGGLLHLCSAEQVACLHDDLKGVAEIVCDSAHFDCEIFGYLRNIAFVLGTWSVGKILIGHRRESCFVGNETPDGGIGLSRAGGIDRGLRVCKTECSRFSGSGWNA
jgi:hypothetical protein